MSKKKYTRKIKCYGSCIKPGETGVDINLLQSWTNNSKKDICTGWFFTKYISIIF